LKDPRPSRLLVPTTPVIDEKFAGGRKKDKKGDLRPEA